MKSNVAKTFTFLTFGIAAASVYAKAEKQETKRPNILFIAVDDLKPDLNCFGFSEVKSPNIDQLAKHATIFTLNYCQQAVCGPTRASLLTGLNPDKTKVWDLHTLIRDKNPNVLTLPEYFKQNGYITSAMGKIFDPRSVDKKHDSISWSLPYQNKFTYAKAYGRPVAWSFQSPELKKKFAKLKMGKSDAARDEDNFVKEIKVSTECIDVPDDAYFDGAMTKKAIIDLKKLGKEGKPFFLAVGFHKPHLPFVAPKKYWDLYDPKKIELAEWRKPSINGPMIAYHNSGELRSYNDIHPVSPGHLLKLSEDKQRELIHGYYACISYTDAQIGKILATLKESGLDKNTIVVLWGDHGWHLGDHSLWCKHSNFEQATRAPLIISLPWQNKEQIYSNPTEFVDIFPTLCELTNLPVPKNLDGKSLVPAIKNPSEEVRAYAVSQYPRQKDKMGYTIRTKRFRYTEWISGNFRTNKVYDPKLVVARELYDYKKDPLETHNYIDNPEYKEDQIKLERLFKECMKREYESDRRYAKMAN